MALKLEAWTGAARGRVSANCPAPASIRHIGVCHFIAPVLLQSRSRWRAASRSGTIVCVAEASEAVVESPRSSETSTSSSGPPTADTWELDFSSRPLLDERGKKKWELLICDPARTWEYSAYFPNNKINSTQLRQALEDILSLEGAKKPTRVRFFRVQMQTIITRALQELDIKPVQSRRCFSLIEWLNEREEGVYKKDPAYSDKATSLFMLDLGAPQDLPDALRGEAWSFVQLPLGILQEELASVSKGEVFGDTVVLSRQQVEGLTSESQIPGVAVYSRRATPLAAWTSGLEVANVVADADRSCLVLETGASQRWRYGTFERTPQNRAEATAWEEAKQAVNGIHFLTVQTDEEAEGCAGLWLLQDVKLPNV